MLISRCPSQEKIRARGNRSATTCSELILKYFSFTLGKFELFLQLIELFVSLHQHIFFSLDLFDVTGKDAVVAVTLINQTMQFLYFIIQFIASELIIVDLIRVRISRIRCRCFCSSTETLTECSEELVCLFREEGLSSIRATCCSSCCCPQHFLGVIEVFDLERILVLVDQGHLNLQELLVHMIEIGEFERYLLSIKVCRVSLVVLITELLDPLGDFQFSSLALSLDVEVLFHVDFAIDEIYHRLVLALLRLIRPKVLDFTLLGTSLETYDASFLLPFDPSKGIELLLFLVYDLSGLILELVEHFTVVLLALTFVVSELQFHSRCVVGVFLDP